LTEINEPDFYVFAGSSHPAFAQEVADVLDTELGKVNLERFPDGELCCQILENVRGRDTFVIQSVALDPNNHLMELLIMIDALKRASARMIVAVIPYFGYSRQDRLDKPRVPISAKLVANLLVAAGATRVLTMDLHTGQLQGFFDVPVDNLIAMPLMIKAFQALHQGNVAVVTPDIGSIKLARAYATALHADFVIIDKHRKSPTDTEVVSVIGDVKGKDILLADDMCSTGGTLASAAKACREKGALKIYASVTHGLCVSKAVSKIEQSPIEAFLMSNTIPYTDRLSGFSKLHQVSVASHFAHAIQCILSKESISAL
jgi:ribose-phosphate pyrophosphokinase